MAAAPERFGKYDLERRIAFGGMAEIFLARLMGEAGFAKKTVLKRILPQFSSDPRFVQMFIDEAVIAARLTHPNIVQIYDFGEVDGVYFIAMEWVDGIDLKEVIARTQRMGSLLSAVEVAAIGEGICNGLGYVHEFAGDDGQPVNIIHRDISPHNVMLSRSGTPKVMDFGIAKAEERATRTKTGVVKGKLAYMAPEQALAEPLDARCDQFAVGLVLWECLTGTRMYTGTSDMDLMRKVADCQTRPLRELRPDVPPELDAIVARALAKGREERYPSLRAMEHDLAAFRFSHGEAGAVHLGAVVDALAPRQASGAVPAMPSHREQREPTAKTAILAEPDLDLPDVATAIAPAARASRGLHRAVYALTAVAALSLAALAYTLATERAPPSAAAAPVHMDRLQNTLSGTLTVRSTPPGAAIAIDGVDVGLRTPAKIPGLRIGEAVDVELRLAGREVFRQRITVGGAEQSMDAALVAGGESPPTTEQARDAGEPSARPVTSEPVETIATAHQDEPLPAPNEQRARPTKHAGSGATSRSDEPAGDRSTRAHDRASPANEKEPGRLSLRLRSGWAEVYLGRRRLGTTPINGAELPSGEHTLRLVNRDTGVEQTLQISVPPGGHVKKTLTLR